MIEVALDVLAAARLARLVRRDTITAPARDWIDVRAYDGDADVAPYAFVRDLLDCPWCATVWTAGAILALRRIPGGRVVRDLLAVAAVAGFVEDYSDR